MVEVREPSPVRGEQPPSSGPASTADSVLPGRPKVARGLGRQVDVALLFNRLHSGSPPTLGRYEVQEKLGEGGMGAVYAARDPLLGRSLAIKVLHNERLLHLQKQIEHEARALARLSHRHVVSIYDIGEVDGQMFVAMELMSGGTLWTWLKASRRTWQEGLQWMLDAGEGLAAAHAAGVVHCDFKPDNVLIGADGSARVSDFGLSRLSGETVVTEHLSPHSPTPMEGLDPPGMSSGVRGTPGFIAPELKRGELPSVLSDQFAFAVSLQRVLECCAELPEVSFDRWPA